MTIVKTRNSTYHIDQIEKTWERTENNGDISIMPLRSTKGTYLEISSIEVGKHILMGCPPFKPSSDMRLIVTSSVLSFEEVA